MLLGRGAEVPARGGGGEDCRGVHPGRGGEPDVRDDLQWDDRTHRGGSDDVRPERRDLWRALRRVLRGPQPEAAESARKRCGNSVQEWDLLPRRGAEEGRGGEEGPGRGGGHRGPGRRQVLARGGVPPAVLGEGGKVWLRAVGREGLHRQDSMLWLGCLLSLPGIKFLFDFEIETSNRRHLAAPRHFSSSSRHEYGATRYTLPSIALTPSASKSFGLAKFVSTTLCHLFPLAGFGKAFSTQ
mmetsp:Transcript_4179/g.12183  ORF Transcript_4179/g.12183 Transcript_4179/m.12183 type:complete len:241 (+) Transcript_4179:356-1078(+)